MPLMSKSPMSWRSCSSSKITADCSRGSPPGDRRRRWLVGSRGSASESLEMLRRCRGGLKDEDGLSGSSPGGPLLVLRLEKLLSDHSRMGCGPSS